MVALIADARAQWEELDRRIAAFDAEFVSWAKENEVARRLTTIPGFGAMTASALVAAVGQAESRREFPSATSSNTRRRNSSEYGRPTIAPSRIRAPIDSHLVRFGNLEASVRSAARNCARSGSGPH